MNCKHLTKHGLLIKKRKKERTLNEGNREKKKKGSKSKQKTTLKNTNAELRALRGEIK